ncbi:hypothetical protein M9H77_27075 [Catharanthus roseus]|uniref:Uncharacterized protein n=1 Tax=Catharanthus roseus TaxID=4058 RepID=A0ACC0ACW7_CATRO|nr:hypothetical protein M9H77_27075 [Catharanthus roseus]
MKAVEEDMEFGINCGASYKNEEEGAEVGVRDHFTAVQPVGRVVSAEHAEALAILKGCKILNIERKVRAIPLSFLGRLLDTLGPPQGLVLWWLWGLIALVVVVVEQFGECSHFDLAFAAALTNLMTVSSINCVERYQPLVVGGFCFAGQPWMLRRLDGVGSLLDMRIAEDLL